MLGLQSNQPYHDCLVGHFFASPCWHSAYSSDHRRLSRPWHYCPLCQFFGSNGRSCLSPLTGTHCQGFWPAAIDSRRTKWCDQAMDRSSCGCPPDLASWAETDCCVVDLTVKRFLVPWSFYHQSCKCSSFEIATKIGTDCSTWANLNQLAT